MSHVSRRRAASVVAGVQSSHPVTMAGRLETQAADELRRRLRPFGEKHRIRKLEIFGSAARGRQVPALMWTCW